MGGVIQIQVFRPDLKGEMFFFQSFFVDEFLYYPYNCFWEILVENVFVCCV
jgi:hypothetical protein